MNPFELSSEPRLYRFIDGAVILIIGMVLGLVISQGIAFMEMTTTTTTETIRRVPLQTAPEAEESGEVSAPKNSVRFEEI